MSAYGAMSPLVEDAMERISLSLGGNFVFISALLILQTFCKRSLTCSPRSQTPSLSLLIWLMPFIQIMVPSTRITTDLR